MSKYETFQVSRTWAFKRRLAYYRTLHEDAEAQKMKFTSMRARYSKRSHWFIDGYIINAERRMAKVARSIYYIKKILRTPEDEQQNTVDIEDIKQIPITRLVDMYNLKRQKSTQNRLYCSLRPHDKTPSCCIYTDQNSFYDFGSCQGGSVIDFYMALESVDLSTAIKDLQNYL